MARPAATSSKATKPCAMSNTKPCLPSMLWLSETGTRYRVATGLEQERLAAFRAIAANNAAGCVVDAATYHCIRRLGLEDAVIGVCGKVGIAQAIADLYQSRLQSIGLEK